MLIWLNSEVAGADDAALLRCNMRSFDQHYGQPRCPAHKCFFLKQWIEFVRFLFTFVENCNDLTD